MWLDAVSLLFCIYTVAVVKFQLEIICTSSLQIRRCRRFFLNAFLFLFTIIYDMSIYLWRMIQIYNEWFGSYFLARSHSYSLLTFQDPAGIFELIEVVGNGTYGQVYKVSVYRLCSHVMAHHFAQSRVFDLSYMHKHWMIHSFCLLGATHKNWPIGCH